ncbi:MAG: hypothetical protein N2595_07175 [bacterium]|nr:hypothetical protein [bacterium]
MKRCVSRMAMNAILLGLVMGGIVGVAFWLLTDRPVASMLFGLVPLCLSLILVRNHFWEPYPPEDE